VTLLKDPEWRAEGIRWMARTAGVSPGYVHKLYDQLVSVHSEQIAKPDARTVTRGGSTYTMNTANIGARAAGADPLCAGARERQDGAGLPWARAPLGLGPLPGRTLGIHGQGCGLALRRD